MDESIYECIGFDWLVRGVRFTPLLSENSFVAKTWEVDEDTLVATPKKNTEVEVIDIPLDEIKVSKRLRSVSEEKVDAIADSINWYVLEYSYGWG